MLTLVQLVEILQQTQVISPAHMNRLRRIAEASPKEFTPSIALRWLIEQKQLTMGQAERLVVLIDPDLAASLHEIHDDTPIPLDDAPQPRDLSTSPQIPVRTPWTNPNDPVGPVTPPAAPVSNVQHSAPVQPAPTQAAVAPAAPAIPVAERAAPATPVPIPVPTAPRGLLDELLDSVAPANPLGLGSQTLLDVRAPVKRRAGTWDSPLILIGGGALLLMLIVGTVLWFVLGRESGDELLRLADDDVRQGAFDQAIFKYDRFITSHGSHPRASYARVQRGTARLRKAVDTTTDWPANLALAQRVVTEIASESSFAEARPELAALLPRIAEHLAKTAVEQSGEAELNIARESFELATKPQLIPEAMRPTVKLQEIEGMLRLAERRQQRAQSLTETTMAIVAAAQTGDFATGFDRHRQLLRTYPDLRGDVKLAEAMQSLSAGLREAVKHESLNAEPLTADVETIITRAVTPVLYLTGEPAEAKPDGDVVVVPIDGSAYAFDAVSGRALWRRFIGRGGFVQRIDASPQSDALLVDAVRNELIRLDGHTGGVRWRASFEKPIIAAPTILRGNALVASSGGSLYQIDLAKGVTTDRWRLPQELATAPIVDTTESLIYVVADHSKLYILSRSKRSCVEIVSTGHAAGQIRVPPVIVGRYLFCAQGQTSEAGLLRSWLANVDGLELKPGNSQPYRGQITTPLATQGRSLALVNEFGAVTIYDVAVGEQSSLKKLIELPGDNESPLARYLQWSGAKLTLSGYEATVNELQASRGRLARLWTSSGTEPIVTAPQSIGERLIYVRKSDSQGAWIVEGAETVTTGKRWQTWLAATVSLQFSKNNDSIQLTSATGDRFDVKGDLTSNQSFASLNRPASEPLVALNALPLDTSRSLLWTRDQRLVAIGAAGKKPEQVRTKVPSAPVIFQGNLLAPSMTGEIEALRSADLSRAWEPFQPSLTPGVDYLWTQPSIADDGQSFVVSDQRTNVYRVGLKQQPKAHLTDLATAQVAEPVEALIVAGDNAYGRDRNGRISSFALADLKPGEHWDLNVSPEGGPWPAGSRALVLSSSGEIWCLAEGKAAWHISWPHGVLAGEPYVEGDSALLATRGGMIVRLNLIDGAIASLANVNQPLVGAARKLDAHWLVTTADGTLLWLDIERSTP
jgi:outer membrane protein assembly factor BamB